MRNLILLLVAMLVCSTILGCGASLAPSTSTGIGLSRDNPLPMGQSLTTPDGIQVTVMSLTKDDSAWQIIHAANQFNEAPAADMQYVIVTVKAKNISSEDEPYQLLDMYFDLVGSSNKAFNTYDKSVVLPDEGDLRELRAELYHGGEAIGSVHFYIPESETNLVLIWSPLSLQDNTKRYFEVQ